VRSRDVTLAVGPPGRLSVRNRLVATIVSLAELANRDVAVRLDVGGEPMVARVTREAARELELAPGQTVTVLLKTVALDDRSI
jgi:molybdate transport system ATP-binding protein